MDHYYIYQQSFSFFELPQQIFSLNLRPSCLIKAIKVIISKVSLFATKVVEAEAVFMEIKVKVFKVMVVTSIEVELIIEVSVRIKVAISIMVINIMVIEVALMATSEVIFELRETKIRVREVLIYQETLIKGLHVMD